MKIEWKNILKKGVIILGVYLIFTLYLFLVAERIERLDKNGVSKNSGYTLKINK